MLRGAGACFVLEVRRGSRGLLIGMVAAVIVAAVNAVIPTGADRPAAILMMVLPGMFGLLAGLTPYGALVSDRLEGRLALERGLPHPWFVTAVARLAGASVRTLVTPFFALAVSVGAARQVGGGMAWFAAAGIAVVAWAAVTIICWTLMAMNVRWSMLRLWWVPTSLWLAPQFVPDDWWALVGDRLRPLRTAAFTALTDPAGIRTVVLVTLAVMAVALVAASALYASGLRRFVHDPDPLRLQGRRDRARPALEYPAGQRPLIAAIALHDIRLGVEQLARQWIILAVLVGMAVAGPETLREMAPTYIRVIGYMVPGTVLVALLAARRSGALAALQFFPHPRWHVAVGKLAGVTTLAALAAMVAAVGRRFADGGFVFDARGFAVSVLLIAANIWIATAVAAWWRVRHLLWLVPLATVLALVGVLAGDALGDMTALVTIARHPVAPLLWFGVAAVAGIPLFARGLATYEKR